MAKTAGFSFTKAATIRDELLATAFFPFYGSVLEGEVFAQLVTACAAVVAPGRPSLGALYETCRVLAGREFTHELATALAWTLAGNFKELAAGQTILPWSGRLERVVVLPIEVINVRRACRIALIKPDAAVSGHFERQRRHGAYVTVRFWGGAPAGLTTEVFWSHDQCNLHKVSFGFDRFNREGKSRFARPRLYWTYSDPLEFCGLRAFARVEPELCEGTTIGFREVLAKPSTKGYCREILLRRQRETFVCPLAYARENVECHECHAGLDFCPAACHPLSFETRPCPCCRRPQAYFNPVAVPASRELLETAVCVRCAATMTDEETEGRSFARAWQ
jgi:hypothetical protein